MKKFIVLEGGDGAGKSSTAEKLAKQINGLYYKTPPFPMNSIRTCIESTGDFNLRFLYYLTSTFYASHEISQLLKNQHVVCDRYIYSTIAYHKVLGVHIQPEIENQVLQPDFSFCLFVQTEELKRRIAKRSELGTFDNDFNMQLKVIEEFKKFKLHFIDTTLSDVNQTVTKIRQVIRL